MEGLGIRLSARDSEMKAALKKLSVVRPYRFRANKGQLQTFEGLTLKTRPDSEMKAALKKLSQVLPV